jgi:hypothetical protein
MRQPEGARPLGKRARPRSFMRVEAPAVIAWKLYNSVHTTLRAFGSRGTANTPSGPLTIG